MAKTAPSGGKVRTWQISSILRAAYKSPGLTRMDLSRSLAVDKAMVTHLIGQLTEAGWFEGSAASAKKVRLELVKDRLLAAGLEIQPERQRLVVCDLEGGLRLRKTWNRGLRDIGAFIEGTVARTLDSSGLLVAGVGVALPGICDRDSGTLIRSIPFGVEQPLRLPACCGGSSASVFVDNDARCCGWGLVAFKKEVEDFFLLYVDLIDDPEDKRSYKRIARGSALFLENRAYRGVHGCAGELPSFFKIDEYRSGGSYIAYPDRLRMRSDPKTRRQFLKELAITTAYVASAIDVRKLYLGGSLEADIPDAAAEFGKYLEEYRLYPDLQRIEVLLAGTDSYSTARGAAGLAFETLFSEPALEAPTEFYRRVAGA